MPIHNDIPERYQVGILLFDEVEVMDFAGPFEVFSLAETVDKQKLFQVHTISPDGELISARNGLKVQPDYAIQDMPAMDILIIPGGYGAEEIIIHDPVIIKWIQTQAQQVKLLASICTGALVLAEAGLLQGLEATTHWMDLDRLQQDYPDVIVKSGVKFVDQGSIMTSAGISAGIHLALHIVSEWVNIDCARTIIKRMDIDIEM
ncbi:DJ-1/PfpI family protein [Paenibacillus sp. PsM32]|uniref:DJ-1/PfpI family protein n=1 Tax=Paenibacillus kyungheensis TaxID=1452732 RepID=A0AAX3LZY9_9BACL|nr:MULTISPECIES: DJ-1/PfpI family protein [Paenibacillus]MDN4620474.1 DJ-1/PfpI family protein [Paenibacillus sp. PsM32]WCT55200.1 DJ-1/PfpI family protein [Paenibacillus kyungheensis]WDF51644.1 DJ-1/PfpI family protein [Paenibacillus sp. KACC 21273]